MDRKIDSAEQFEAEFDRNIRLDDDSEAKALLAAGRPIHICRSDTPAEHVLRVHPDGREELIHIDISHIARRRNIAR